MATEMPNEAVRQRTPNSLCPNRMQTSRMRRQKSGYYSGQNDVSSRGTSVHFGIPNRGFESEGAGYKKKGGPLIGPPNTGLKFWMGKTPNLRFPE